MFCRQCGAEVGNEDTFCTKCGFDLKNGTAKKQEKKEYVMTKANQFALDNGIKFNEEFISNKIEDLLSLTNQVNVNKNKTIKISNKVGNKNGI